MNPLRLLFFVAICIFSSTLVSAAVCPLYAPGSSSFFQNPVSLSESSQTCCTPDLLGKIQNGTDDISFYLLPQLSKSTEKCRAAVTAIASSVCSPFSENYITNPSYGIEIRLCHSTLCSKFQSDCAAANFHPLGDQPVPSLDTELLCSMLFPTPNYRVSVPVGSHPACFADPTATNPRPCSPSDYTGTYTRCSISTREVVYSWKSDSTCEGGQTLPPPITGLPCEISCPV